MRLEAEHTKRSEFRFIYYIGSKVAYVIFRIDRLASASLQGGLADLTSCSWLEVSKEAHHRLIRSICLYLCQ